MNLPELLLQTSAIIAVHVRAMERLRLLSPLCGGDSGQEGPLEFALRGAFYSSVVATEKLVEFAAEALHELQNDLEDGALGKLDPPA